MLNTSNDITAITTADFAKKIVWHEMDREIMKRFKILGKELASTLTRQIADKYDLQVEMQNLPSGRIVVGARLKLKSSRGVNPDATINK